MNLDIDDGEQYNGGAVGAAFLGLLFEAAVALLVWVLLKAGGVL